MKKCSYCGRENSDEATQCSGCGTQEFKVELPPTALPGAEDRKQNQPAVQKNLSLRLLIAGCVWLVISGISLHVAWQQANHSIAWEEQWSTQHELENMGRAIIAFQTKYNSTPTNFEQLQGMSNEIPEIGWWFSETFADGWHHPLIFSNKGTDCIIISYGGDGKPGGTGIDHDLASDDPYSQQSTPTFTQFWSNKQCEGMINW